MHIFKTIKKKKIKKYVKSVLCFGEKFLEEFLKKFNLYKKIPICFEHFFL